MIRTITLRMATVAACLAVLVFAAPAYATTVMVVDNGKLWSDTKAGKDAQRQLQEFREQLEGIVGAPLEEIATEASDLVKKREDEQVEDAEFAQQARVLQAREMQIRNQAQQALRQAAISARSQFFEAVRPILLEMLKEENGDILMDKSQVMFTMDSVEATSAAIIKIESNLPELEIELPELSTGEEQGPAAPSE